MILIDSGFLIALIDRKDELHDRAIAWAKHLRNEALLASDLVLVEAYNFFAAPTNRGFADQALTRFLTNSSVQLLTTETSHPDAGRQLFRTRQDKAWSLTDCVSFALMGEFGMTTALAFDHHFEQAGFEALLRRDPDGSH